MQDPCTPFSNDFVFFQAIQEGIEEAHNCLYIRMYRICIPYALSRSTKRFTEEDALDILHDAFITVLTKIKTGAFTLTSVPVTQYARKIFWYMWVSFVRKKQKEEPYDEREIADKNDNEELSDQTSSVDDSLNQDEDQNDLWEIIDEAAAQEDDNAWNNKLRCIEQAKNQLSSSCQKLVWWFYIDELSLADCAQRLNLEVTTVKVKRFRCTEAFKKFYKACNP